MVFRQATESVWAYRLNKNYSYGVGIQSVLVVINPALKYPVQSQVSLHLSLLPQVSQSLPQSIKPVVFTRGGSTLIGR